MIYCSKLLVLLGLSVCSDPQIPSACTTPDNKQGTCIDYKKCPPLVRLIKNQSDPYAMDYLSRSICGFEASTQMCCPAQAINLDIINPPNCGVSMDDVDHKILGLHPAKRGADPWIAVIGFWSQLTPSILWGCGGTIVTRRYVVTAAHCTKYSDPSWYVVRVGEHNLNDKVDDGAKPVDYAVSTVIVHPSYVPKKLHHFDIALLQLKKPITYDDYVKPICLPITPELRNNDFSTNSPTVAGWGRLEFYGNASEELMEVVVPVVGNKECSASYQYIIDSQICAGEGGVDSCQGSSGGPLALPRKGNKYYLIGVDSYGKGCATEGYPAVYTRVTSFINWILNNMK